MGEFQSREDLTTQLYNVLKKAKRHLFIVSRYLSLSDNIKLHLNNLKKSSKIKVQILFGKNENETIGVEA